MTKIYLSEAEKRQIELLRRTKQAMKLLAEREKKIGETFKSRGKDIEFVFNDRKLATVKEEHVKGHYVSDFDKVVLRLC